MIKKWSIKNFKSVSAEIKLEFAPLTIFAGANSSGKSTILQSILLATQTIQNTVQSKSIILNGHIIRFGTFDDLLSNNHDGSEIKIGFSLTPLTEGGESRLVSRLGRIREDVDSIELSFSFTGLSSDSNSDILQLQPMLMHSHLRVHKNEALDEIEISRSKKKIIDRIIDLKLSDGNSKKTDLSSLEYEVIKPTRYVPTENHYYYARNPRNGKYAGAVMNHFLPTALSVVYDRVEEEKRQFIDILLRDESYNARIWNQIYDKYINANIKALILTMISDILANISTEIASADSVFLRRFREFYNRLVNEFSYENFKRVLKVQQFGTIVLSKLEEKKTEIFKLLQSEVPEDFELTYISEVDVWSDYIDFYFRRNLKYLGPLRDEPKPVYPLMGSLDPKDIGFKGENTAAVLELNKNEVIKYIPPNYISSSEPNQSPVHESLANAVLNWLEYMGIAKDVNTFDKGKLGHELKISTPGSTYLHDLTHVGVGVSQVLPILVLSLLSNVDSTLIFEQPELHLNPKVQTRLADFFYSMTLLKKQCLVETHSEYLINRLRYLVAQSSDDKMSENIIMYFVEKEMANSKYKMVKLNKYGVIEDWPKGFFDENEETAAAILRAAMEKRKKEKNQ